MAEPPANRELLSAWSRGDQTAADALFDRYVARLRGLVRSRISRRLARRLDPDDVVLSAYRSFFVAARNGRMTADPDGDLWPLLATLALRKLARQGRRHTADRRAVDREVFSGSDAGEAPLVDGIPSREPGPEEAALLEEEVERLLQGCDGTAREVLVRTLRGDDPPAIARALGLHERSVRRALERVRERLSPVPGLPPRTTGPVHSPPPPPSPPPPAFVGAPSEPGTVHWRDYRVERWIGGGAFAKVYRAIEIASGAMLAVKFLRREWWRDERSRGTFFREYAALRRVAHPGLVRMFGWGEAGRGSVFLVMEFVDGPSLDVWQRHVRPAPEAVVAVVRQVALAVAAAHAAGILHGDLKPSNVLIRPDGTPVLCDFGFARSPTGGETTPPGDLGGTAGFLAPEQISEAYGPVTARADVYGLGALLYAVLTGRPPLLGRDLPETLARVLSGESPLPPSVLGGPLPPSLDAVVLRALRKEPAERYASAREFAAALSTSVAERPGAVPDERV